VLLADFLKDDCFERPLEHFSRFFNAKFPSGSNEPLGLRLVCEFAFAFPLRLWLWLFGHTDAFRQLVVR
jgi:hypothetical protein